ncbi:helix-turn-helix domain-containing protein [Catelliglobosispora koreensis]|uniref:helix-turn-helix domain-containing protein n=1 Tax=Catelliglobosispora koreensis TaxID=129052 RepID=UPI0003615E16|nr:helix-turn-helix transcriptional regulator [Catelliglobosispora koreensis]
MGEPATPREQTLREGVAEEIRALMGRRNVSRQTMARALGVSHTTVWRRLSGDTALDLDELERVARVLGVEVTDLFPREGRVVVFADGTRRQTTGP